MIKKNPFPLFAFIHLLSANGVKSQNDSKIKKEEEKYLTKNV
jgi:hypothetical protein